MTVGTAWAVIIGALIPIIGIIYVARGQAREQAARERAERESIRSAAYQDGYRDGKQDTRSDYLERQVGESRHDYLNRQQDQRTQLANEQREQRDRDNGG